MPATVSPAFTTWVVAPPAGCLIPCFVPPVEGDPDPALPAGRCRSWPRMMRFGFFRWFRATMAVIDVPWRLAIDPRVSPRATLYDEEAAAGAADPLTRIV